MNTKILRILTISLPVSLLVLLAGCLKTHEGFTDFSTTGDFVLLTGAGTGNFKASNVALTSDTVRKTITVNLASNNNNNGNVAVTLGVDASAISAYNTANGTKYQPFPSGSYKLGSTTVTVPAGQHYGTTTLEIYRSKLDPAVDYMLPIAITDGGGKQLSSNQNIIYYNIIGNPLAGNYNVNGTRYNYTGSIGYTCGSPVPPGYGSTNASPSPKSGLPVDSKVIAFDYANLGGSGYQYLVSIDPSNPNNAIVTSNSTLAASLSVNYCVHTYNPATKTFHIVSWYNNGTNGSGGSDRVIDETFVHQ
jgi:hypothetical protein